MRDRIKKLRKKKELSQEKFGKALGVTKSTISNIENGRFNVTETMIELICTKFGVNEEWLRTGKGGDENMFVKASKDEEYEEAAKQLSNDPLVRSLMIQYWKLNDDNKKQFRDFIYNLADDMKRSEKGMSAKERIEKEVDEYRRELELEGKVVEKSSASGEQEENTKERKWNSTA